MVWLFTAGILASRYAPQTQTSSFKNVTSLIEKNRFARCSSVVETEQKGAANEDFRGAEEPSRKASSSMPFRLKTAKTARLLGYQLESYPSAWLCSTDSVDLPYSSYCPLACMRFTLGGISALDALCFHPLATRHELVDSLFLRI